MIITVANTRYKVWFTHTPPLIKPRVVTAHIATLDAYGDPLQVFHGSAICHPKDKFSYEVGRNTALAYLFVQWPELFPRKSEARREFWAGYRGRKEK